MLIPTLASIVYCIDEKSKMKINHDMENYFIKAGQNNPIGYAH